MTPADDAEDGAGRGTRRSLLLWGVGVVVGLVLAGDALFAAKGTTVGGIPPEDAAVVNGRPILASDVAAQIQTSLGIPFDKATPDQRRRVVEDLVREELYVQRGLELDEPSVDPDTRAALVSAVQAQVAVDATSRTPTSEELQAFYARRREQFSSIGVMTMRDLIVAAALPLNVQADILAKARQALDGRTPVDAVIRRFGLKDSGRVDGEELYFAAKLHLGTRLFDVARALGDGQTAAPVQAADGVHLIHMIKNDRPTPRPLNLVMNQVYNDYKEALQQSMQDSEYKYLRNKASVQIARNYGG